MKVDALIFGVLPPPVGGVASIVAMLYDHLSNRGDILFSSPAVKDGRWGVARPFRSILSLTLAIGKVRKGGRILFFSGAGNSFFEKLVWALLILLRDRKPVVVMIDGNFPSFWSKKFRGWHLVASWVINHEGFELTVQSEGWKKYYQSIFHRAHIEVVGATVASDYFEYVQEYTPPSDFVTILYVGWIVPEKGVLDLLDAVGILKEKRSNIRLRLVGPLFGKDEYWAKAIAERGISMQVQVIGPLIDRAKLIREFASSDVFAFPSHVEGFPVALLEAITMGLACVGTSVGGIPDILDQGRAGILVAPQAPSELAEALESLISDPVRRRALSKKAAMRARSVYGRSQCIESYRRLLGVK